MKFPKTIYVKIEEDGDEPWLNASEDPAAHAEFGESIPIAEYQLVRATVVKSKVEVA